VITILWPDYWAAYTANHHGKPGTPAPVRATRELLTPLPEVTGKEPRHIDTGSGEVVDVPDHFTDSDLTYARDRGDPVLAEAITVATRAGSPGRLTQ
jgi:hypothetical protein